MATEIVKLAPDTKKFTANGKTYILHESLTLKRFWEFARLRVAFGMNADIIDVYNTTLSFYNLIPEIIRNATVGAETYVKLRDLLQGLNELNSRMPIAFYICTLFFNYEGENISQWSREEAELKIDDWNEEGIDSAFFLLHAIPLLHDFLIHYKNTMNQFLEADKELQGFLISSLNFMTSD